MVEKSNDKFQCNFQGVDTKHLVGIVNGVSRQLHTKPLASTFM